MASMDESVISSGRRERMPPLRIEIGTVSGLKDELDDLMSDRIDEMEDEKLKEF